jgi:hypothetical protein
MARKGAKRPIFEGNMPPKKMYPQNWRQYWRHNRNPVKRGPIITGYVGHIFPKIGVQILTLYTYYHTLSPVQQI